MANDITVPGGTLLGSFGGFNVVLVRKGDRYGLDNCLTHDKGDPMVEFYDERFIKKGFTTAGQFVSRYNLSTLIMRDQRFGICLDGGVPAWNIGPDALAAAVKEAVAIFFAAA